MKLCLSAATLALLPLWPGGPGDAGAADVRVDYATDRTLRITATASLELETTDFYFERDGERSDGGGFGGGASLEERTVEEAYTALAVADGAPTRARRAFGVVERSTTTEMGDESFEGGGEGALADVTLELALDDGEVVAEVVEGSEPDAESALEGHHLALACDGLLPDGEVDVDAAWELEAGAILAALGLDLEDAYFPLEEPGDDGGEGGRGRGFGGPRPSAFRNLASAAWEGEATYAGEVDHDGVACHAIALELEAEGELPEMRFGGGRRGRMASGPGTGRPLAENTLTAELEGRLLVAVDGAHPVLLELEGTVSTVRHNEFERGGSTMAIHTEQEGVLEVRVEVAAEPREE